MRSIRILLIAVMLVAIGVGAGASVLTATGYTCADTVITMPAWAFLGGFDLLPNGNFVINDGYTIREVSPAGDDLTTLFTFPAPVLGSFVRCCDDVLYFGESSPGSSKIYRMSLTGGDAQCLTSLANNFDMDSRAGRPYVVAGSGVYLLNDDNTTTPIASAPGYSGPLAFDRRGDLFYAPSLFPSGTSILKWDKHDVNRAPRLDAVLSADDAEALVPIGGAYGFAFDDKNRLLFTDNLGAAPYLARFDGSEITTLATFNVSGVWFPAMTFVRVAPNGKTICLGVTYFNADFSGSSTCITTLREIKQQGCRK